MVYTVSVMIATVGLVALLVASVAVNGADICGLENYDTESLRRHDYWYFNISSGECASDAGHVSCRVYFAVCDKVPPEYCGGDSNSGVCQLVVPDSDNTIHQYYSLGKAPSQLQSDSNGFLAFYTNGTSNSTESCKGKPIDVTLSFNCNKNNVWNLTNQDVTKHFVGYTMNVKGCQIYAALNYSGACVKQVPVVPGCNSKSVQHYDLSVIRTQELWRATVDDKFCAGNGLSRSDGAADTCELYFSFCAPLPYGFCYNSIFCYKEPFLLPVSLGSYEDLSFLGDADYTGFTISASGGSKTKDCPNGRFSVLRFNCSSSATWTDIDISNFTSPVQSIDPCEFLVDFQYSGACTSYRPKKSGEQKPIVGWVLIGIFFGILILYLGVGAVVQFARGRKGVNLIPNYEQWKMFFILVLEGCQFTLDVVTCFQCQHLSMASKLDYEAL